MMRIEQCPQWIIRTGGDGKFLVDDGLLKELISITAPTVAIAITGKYRTGKSYLMNRIAGVQRGFATASTVECKTKGIWIWVRDHPYSKGVKLILLDTEGLGEPSKQTANHDNWIFILATLLSSVVIHNTVGSVGKDIISDLSCVTELSRKLMQQGGISNKVPPPRFVLALRDFSLTLQIQGKTVTPDEYFEYFLTNKETDEPELQCPRESIKKFFPRRKCFIFDRPGTRAQLEHLNVIPDSQLADDFLNDLRVFLEYVYKICEPRHVCGRPINGSILGGLITNYVNGINLGAVPSVDSTFLAVIIGENEKLKEMCVKLYTTNLRQKLPLPLEDLTELERWHETLHKECLDSFSRHCYGDEDTKENFLVTLNVAIQKKYQEFRMENDTVSTEKCKVWLEPKGTELTMNVAVGAYDVPDGRRKFDQDFRNIELQYRSAPGLGLMREYVWEWFQQNWAKVALNVKWKEVIRCAFLPWRENREKNIMSLIGIIEDIEGQEKKLRIGNITYSSVGIVSAGLTIGGIIAAPFTAGASLGLTAAGIATGVASGAAGGIHTVTKVVKVKKSCEQSKQLLEEDRAQFEILQKKIEELDNFATQVSMRLNEDESTISLAYGVGKTAGAIGRLTFGVVDIAADFARIGGRVMGPVVGVFAILDAIVIGYSAHKLKQAELSERSKQINECVIQLGDGLQQTNEWFRSILPPELKDLIPM